MSKNKKTAGTSGFLSALKTLSKSIRQYKTPSILAPLFVAIEVVLECFIPFVMTLLLGELKSSSADQMLNVVLKYGLILLCLAFLSLSCGALSGRFCAVASSGFAKNLRKDMYYTVQNFSFANIDKFSSSSLITRLTTDVMHVEMSYMMIIRTAVRSPFMLIFSMVMAFTLNAKMALIFLCTTPILAVGLILIMTKAIPFFNRIFKKYDKMNESV